MKLWLTILSFVALHATGQDSTVLVFNGELAKPGAQVYYSVSNVLYQPALQPIKQKRKWYRFDISDVGMIACGALGGANRGRNEAIVFRGYGKGNEFWDKDISWKRKYKDYDGGDKSEAFPLSKSVLVGFTDGYHGTNLGQTMCYVGGALIIGFDMLKGYDKPFLAMGKKLAEYLIANGLMFWVFFK